MPNTIADYYNDELVDFTDTILFYNNEIEELNIKLEDVIRRNSIIDIAAKVESKKTLLARISDEFSKLQTDFLSQDALLIQNNVPIDNSLVSRDMEENQNELRRKMQHLEKVYIDLKYSCYDFIAHTLIH